jgi:hypothetical protein
MFNKIATTLCATMNYVKPSSRIAEDQELRLELGRRGVKRAAKFSWARCAEETARVYHAAAEEHSRTV